MKLSHQISRHAEFGARRASTAQKGYVLVMFALLLIPMLFMAGLSVDVGSWYNRAAQIRKAADAAALAGVVWLPNTSDAEGAAREAAAKNGFDEADPGITIEVETSNVSSRRIRVTITDDSVGSFFWGNLGGRDIELTRTSFAEYVLPVPLGSPRNFFGLGILFDNPGVDPPFATEYLYNSVNPFCTAKENGDRYQSGYHGVCSGSANGEFNPDGYSFYIDAVAGRPDDIEVLLYDPRYNEDEGTGFMSPPVCRWEWPNWTERRSNESRTFTLTERGQYQSYSTWSGWSNISNLDPGNYNINNGVRYRFRQRYEICTQAEITEKAPDDERVNNGRDTYTFILYAADTTPLNDGDNPEMCRAVFEYDTPFDASLQGYLGSRRWNKMPCTIPKGGQSGRYIMKVRNSATANSPRNDGSNQYGVIARYPSSVGTDYGLCDGRNDNVCPRVYGKAALSVKAAAVATKASFYLAEIEPEHAGKTLRITLFDPGEGGNFIEIHGPTGADSWARVSFVYRVDGGNWSGNTSRLDVTGNRYNGKVVEIDVKLNSYNPPSNNHWWQIYYDFASGVAVTDRTTWEAEVLGDPIHLVEEF